MLFGSPIGVLDADGFWAPLAIALDGAVSSGFLAPANRVLLASAATLPALLATFEEVWSAVEQSPQANSSTAR